MAGKKGAKPAVVSSAPAAAVAPTETGDAAQQQGPKRSDDSCVFVGNVAFTTTWQKLKDVMRKAGDVQLVELVVDSSHKPKGSALVTFSNPDDAKKAVQELNSTLVDGRELLVRPYEKGARPLVIYGNYTREQLNRVLPKDKQQPVAAPAAAAGKPQHQHAHHQQHHQPQQQNPAQLPDRVSLRPTTGAAGSKGEFRVFDGGDFNKRNRDTFGDEAVSYRPNGTGVPEAQAAPAPTSEQRRKLFVSNLPFTCTWKLLKDTFAQVGKVLRADIIMDERGRSRGMGTVVFASMEDAMRAIDEFDGIEMEGRPMGVRLDRDFAGGPQH